MARAKKSKNRVSVWNWMLTLLLMAIPGVNIIALICYLIFAKAQPKRSYMAAVLIWSILIVIGVVAALMLMPEQLARFSDTLRSQLDALPTIAPVITPNP